MSCALKIDEQEHDLIIKNGGFQTVSGAEEIKQRIIVALKHYFAEYVFDRLAGVPWYQRILGMKGNFKSVEILLREYIAGIPGVDYVLSLNVVRQGRDYAVRISVLLQGGEKTTINNVQIEVE